MIYTNIVTLHPHHISQISRSANRLFGNGWHRLISAAIFRKHSQVPDGGKGRHGARYRKGSGIKLLYQRKVYLTEP